MCDNRDRAETRLEIDPHLKAVLEFMQEKIPASNLCGVADGVQQMARLLWSEHPQEPKRALSLGITCLGRAGVQQPIASGSAPDTPHADDDSAVEAACP